MNGLEEAAPEEFPEAMLRGVLHSDLIYRQNLRRPKSTLIEIPPGNFRQNQRRYHPSGKDGQVVAALWKDEYTTVNGTINGVL